MIKYPKIVSTLYNEKSNIFNSVCYFILNILLIINITNTLLDSTFLKINIAKNFCQNLTYIFAIISLYKFAVLNKYSYVLLGIIGLSLGIIVKYHTQSNFLLIFVSFVLAFSYLNYKWVMFVFLAVTFCIFIYTFTIFFLDLFDYSIYCIRAGSVRESFGFKHPNTVGLIVFFFCLTFWCINNSHLQNYSSILLIIVSLFFLQRYVDSRTAQHLLLALIIIICVNEISLLLKINADRFFFKIIFKNLIILSFLFISFTYIALVYLYTDNSSFYSTLDSILSSRISLCHRAFENFNITLFGQELILSDVDPYSLSSKQAISYNTLDPFYVHTLFRYGLATLVFFLIYFTFITYKTLINKKYKIVLALLLICIYGLTEKKFVLIGFEVFLYMGMMSFDNITLNKDGHISQGR